MNQVTEKKSKNGRKWSKIAIESCAPCESTVPPRISHEKWSKNGGIFAKKRNEKWRFWNEKHAWAKSHRFTQGRNKQKTGFIQKVANKTKTCFFPSARQAV